MRRRVESELLDEDRGTPAEVASALGDLRMVNRYFGGMRTSERLLRRVLSPIDGKSQVGGKERGRTVELLDVASGSGDIPLELAARWRRRGVELRVTLLDRRPAHLPTNATARTVVGDALRLPFPADSFDVVSCSLFVHHLEPDQFAVFVDEALRVARTALVINDLLRSSLLWALVGIGRPLFRSRMAWRDGLVSVRRAYTEQELRQMLARHGRRVEFSRHSLRRVGIIVRKNGDFPPSI